MADGISRLHNAFVFDEEFWNFQDNVVVLHIKSHLAITNRFVNTRVSTTINVAFDSPVLLSPAFSKKSGGT